MIQNTKEWMEWRHFGIGSSEAPIIMGVSKFKTPLELWKLKINPTPPKDEKNFIHDKGHNLERIARSNYELRHFIDWKPKLVICESEKRFRASLDGWNDELKAVWECKYMGLKKYEKLKNSDLEIRERIPEEYWPQLMHQVMVTGCEEIHFTGIVDHIVLKSLEKGQTEQFDLVFKIDHTHVEYIEKKLLPKLVDFLDAIDNKREPSLMEGDFYVSQDKKLGQLLIRYKALKNKLNDFSKKEKELKKEIFEISLKLHNRVKFKDFKIVETVSNDKEVPDYEKYVKENNLDLINLGFVKKIKGRKVQKIGF